jgi:hypothetical protein
MSNCRATVNRRTRNWPKEMSLSGRFMMGSQTVRKADSTSSIRVPGASQPDSTCSFATRW